MEQYVGMLTERIKRDQVRSFPCSCMCRVLCACAACVMHNLNTGVTLRLSVSLTSRRHHYHADHGCMQLVALYCSKVLGQRALALRVMKRIKIMEEELVRVCELSLFGFVLWVGAGFTKALPRFTCTRPQASAAGVDEEA